jgi:hypothetical protein
MAYDPGELAVEKRRVGLAPDMEFLRKSRLLAIINNRLR